MKQLTNMNDQDKLTSSAFGPQIDSIAVWLQNHSILGWILFVVALVIIFIVFLLNTLPAIDILRSKILKPWRKSKKFNALAKAAKKYDIRGHVNLAVAEIKLELPLGWIREMDIEWVERENREDFFHDEEAVIRVRPYEEQNKNFVNVAHQFLSKAFFPRVKKVIPAVQRDAAILYFSGRIARRRGQDTYNTFVDHVFEPAVDRDAKIVDYHERYKTLDTKGLFTGPFLREIHHVAQEVRTNTLRHQMGTELNEVLKHLEEFSLKYDESQNSNGKLIDEYLWSRNGIVSRYGLMLVAHPFKAAKNGVDGYVHRAQARFDEGVERLYVLGASTENNFAQQVISAIASQTPYEMVERFDLCKDYRGNPGGIGSVFIMVKQTSKS